MTVSKKKIIKKYLKKPTYQKTKKYPLPYERQLLVCLEQEISLNVDSFFVLSEEGDPTQIALAYQKAKNEFMKLGPEMHRIALKLGGDLPYVVADFLESIDIVLHGQGMLDEEKIIHCLDTTARLKAELKKPSEIQRRG